MECLRANARYFGHSIVVPVREVWHHERPAPVRPLNGTEASVVPTRTGTAAVSGAAPANSKCASSRPGCPQTGKSTRPVSGQPEIQLRLRRHSSATDPVYLRLAQLTASSPVLEPVTADQGRTTEAHCAVSRIPLNTPSLLFSNSPSTYSCETSFCPVAAVTCTWMCRAPWIKPRLHSAKQVPAVPPGNELAVTLEIRIAICDRARRMNVSAVVVSPARSPPAHCAWEPHSAPAPCRSASGSRSQKGAPAARCVKRHEMTDVPGSARVRQVFVKPSDAAHQYGLGTHFQRHRVGR